MIVWEYAFSEESFEEIGLVNFDEDREFYDRWRDGIRGEPLPKMEIWTDPESKIPARKGDFPPAASGVIIFSERAVEAYRDLLEGKVKYLSIDCDCGDRYYLVDVPVVDCLDYENSVIDYYPHDPSRRAGIDRFAFKPDIVANEYIFQIPESRARIFVTDIFIERAKAAGLVGISFNKIWDSGTGSFNYWLTVHKKDLILG